MTDGEFGHMVQQQPHEARNQQKTQCTSDYYASNLDSAHIQPGRTTDPYKQHHFMLDARAGNTRSRTATAVGDLVTTAVWLKHSGTSLRN